MLNGFEKETAPLNEYELARAVDIARELKSAYGSEFALTNKAIRQMFPDLSDARVRKIINHIRLNDMVPCLVASTRGYYIATSEEELIKYEESLRGRAETIMEVREQIERQRKMRYGGVIQPSLW